MLRFARSFTLAFLSGRVNQMIGGIKMKTALLFIFALAFGTCASIANAQSERISVGDYNVALAKGLDASAERNRRVWTTETFYSGSQVVGSRKIVSEFAGPDAKRRLRPVHRIMGYDSERSGDRPGPCESAETREDAEADLDDWGA